MKKLVIVLLLISLTLSPLLSAQTKYYLEEEKKDDELLTTSFGFKYSSYEDAEFQTWMHKARRAETLFFGGIPITFAFVSLGYSLLNKEPNFWPMMGISAATSALISLADYIVGEVNDH